MHKITFEAVVDLTTPSGAAMLQELVLMKRPEHSLTIADENLTSKPIQVKSKATPVAKEQPAPVQEEQPAPVQEEQPAPVQEEPQAAVQEEPPAPVQEEQPEILDFSQGKLTTERENEIRQLQRAVLVKNPSKKEEVRAKLNGYGADTLTQLLEKHADKVVEYETFLKSL